MFGIYKKSRNLIEKAGEILLVSHCKPDADTLGSALAMKIWLERIGKEVTVACMDKPAETFCFLPGINAYVQDFELEEFDLIIVVDAGASYMTGYHLKYENFFKSNVPIINIDHHSSNDRFGKINIVDPEAASTTVQIYKLLKQWQVEIDGEIATCLLAGIYGDTGGFMHSNTCKEVYEIASDLYFKGAKMADISKAMFRTKPVSMLKLWGKVLEQAYVTSDSVVMSVLKDGDYDEAGPEQLTGVIDYLNMVPGTKFALLLNEDRKGNVKGSFRTRKSDIDLSRIAAVFGGGGHAKASGFVVPGKLEKESRYSIVSQDMSKKSLDF